MSEAYDKVYDLLDELTEDELTQIKSKIAVLEKWKSKSTEQPTQQNIHQYDDRELLFQALQDIFESKGLPAPHWSVFKNSHNYQKFNEKYQASSEFLDKHFPKRKTERLWAYRYIMKLLVEWVERVNIPVTIGTVSKNLDKIPSIVDWHFPGYANSGLLHIVFSQRR